MKPFQMISGLISPKSIGLMDREDIKFMLNKSKLMFKVSKSLNIGLSICVGPEIDELSATQIISNLSNAESTGFDGVSSKMIKLSYNFILPHLIALINLIISTAVFPQIWKQSKIIPIYKGSGNKQDFKNFRPIALLSVISKIFERHLFYTIYEYLMKNKLLSDYQFGFKPKH
jgi:hypothetical protein